MTLVLGSEEQMMDDLEVNLVKVAASSVVFLAFIWLQEVPPASRLRRGSQIGIRTDLSLNINELSACLMLWNHLHTWKMNVVLSRD